MEEIALRRRIDLSLTDTNIVLIATCSIFLPYILAAFTLITLGLYIIIDKNKRAYIFLHSASKPMKLFFVYVMIAPLLCGNWTGLAIGIFMIIALVFGLYLRSVMTKELFERVLNIICILSLSSSFYAISENLVTSLINHKFSMHRASAMFYHPNYYGTIIGTVTIICVYKILTHQGSRKIYYVVTAANILSMYLCKSMFVWVEVFVGTTVLLFVLKKHRLLALWFTAGVVGGVMVFVLKINVIPRLADVDDTTLVRFKVWRAAIQEIQASPLFGHGFMSFLFVSPKYYGGQAVLHTHSIYLDCLINFGFVGTALFACYFIKYYVAVFKHCFQEKQPMINALILAVTAATMVHGITDVTLLWIQTFPLFLLILSGLGAYEHNKDNIRPIVRYPMDDDRLSKAS